MIVAYEGEHVMKTIETDIVVAADGKAVVELWLPPTVPPGKHRVLVMVDEAGQAAPTTPVELPVHDLGPWPANLSLNREDLYGDHGR